MSIIVDGKEINGLATNEAVERLRIFGRNELNFSKRSSFFSLFLKSFLEPLSAVLLVIAAISLIVEIFSQNLETSTRSNEIVSQLLTPVLIIIVILINNFLSAFNLSKSQRSISVLKKLSQSKTRVIRDGEIVEILSSELVVDDIIFVEAGNQIFADAVLISKSELYVDESSISGESYPVCKNGVDHYNNLDQQKIFSGCFVIRGAGFARVTATGFATEIGKIQKLVNAKLKPKSDLQIKLVKVSKLMGAIGLLIFVMMFIVQMIIHRSELSLPKTWLTILLPAIAFAVAVIPEGIVICINVVLRIGVIKLAKQNAVVKRIDAVESLGNIGVICTDKTGTLTKNQISVICLKLPNKDEHREYNEHCYDLVSCAVLCTDAHLKVNEQNEFVEVGDPTEIALLRMGWQNKIEKEKLLKTFQPVHIVPFDSERKLMTTIHHISGDEYLVVTKGAPEKVLEKCLNLTDKLEIEQVYNKWSACSYRVLGVAKKVVKGNIKDLKDNNLIEGDLEFVGLIGLSDTLREESLQAVKFCQSLGIKVCMITGDNIYTARTIAKKLGILNSDDQAITGDDLDQMSDSQLGENIQQYSVYARVQPSDKLRIVQAWQKQHELVAMTGDGVNDAPALRAANVSYSMGVKGTDVAKDASSIVLMDDNFSTIAYSIKFGRNIGKKIRKIVESSLLFSVAEVIIMFLGMIMIASLYGGKVGLNVFSSIQLLWLNLIAHGFLSTVVGFQDIKINFCKEKEKNFLDKKTVFRIFWRSFVISLFTLASYIIVRSGIGVTDNGVIGSTTFGTFSVSIALSSLSIVSDASIFKCSFRYYKRIWFAVIFIILSSLFLLFVPGISNIFGFANFYNYWWIIFIIFGLGSASILCEEFYKFFSCQLKKICKAV